MSQRGHNDYALKPSEGPLGNKKYRCEGPLGNKIYRCEGLLGNKIYRCEGLLGNKIYRCEGLLGNKIYRCEGLFGNKIYRCSEIKYTVPRVHYFRTYYLYVRPMLRFSTAVLSWLTV